MQKKTIRWPYLAAGVIMMLFAGIIYAWSILKTPLTTEFGWDNTALGLNFTITMCFFACGGILGGILTKRISPRLTIIISAILVFAGFCCSSFMQGDIVILYLTYGGLSGLGIGIAYNVIVSTVTSWFPDKRATASGALMMGFGASTLILGSVTGNLISSIGWRTTYFVLGLAIMIVFFIGSIFIKRPDASYAPKASNDAKQKDTEVKDYTLGEMLRRVSFWKFYVLSILLSSIGSCVISFAKDVSMKVGATESLAILLVGVLAVCNGFGRIIVGFLFDSIGRRKTLLVANTVAILAPIVMLLSLLYSSVALLVVGLVIVGFSYGSMPPISSGFTSSSYGTKNFGLNFSIVNTMLFPASFSATIAGTMVNATGTYVSVFIMLLCFAIVGFVINISLKKI